MIIAETSFEQTEKAFQDFLAENYLPTEILWFFVEDTFSPNTKIYETIFWVKPPLPKEKEILIKRRYAIGQQKNLDICLSALARIKSVVR